MVEEALAACAEAVNRPLSFSPPGIRADEEIHSLTYTPSTACWDKTAALNEKAVALGNNNDIHFGPGVQCEVDGQLITASITEQVAEMILEERRNNIVDSMFAPCEQPILDTPSEQKRQTKVSGRVKTAMGGGVRRSTRQKAQISSVPVSKRATHWLMKAFGVVGPDEPIGDHTLEAYAKRFTTPLSPKAIAAVRSLTSLDSAAAMEASAQLVASEGLDAMQDVGCELVFIFQLLQSYFIMLARTWEVSVSWKMSVSWVDVCLGPSVSVLQSVAVVAVHARMEVVQVLAPTQDRQ
jgi:hypothetical protein